MNIFAHVGTTPRSFSRLKTFNTGFEVGFGDMNLGLRAQLTRALSFLALFNGTTHSNNIVLVVVVVRMEALNCIMWRHIWEEWWPRR